MLDQFLLGKEKEKKMALIELHKSHMSFKAEGDEWNESYEMYSYFYDDNKNQFIEKRNYGIDNARDRAANYEKSENRIIMEDDLPIEALKAWNLLDKT